MTRPSAPAVITAASILSWASVAYTCAAIFDSWYAGAAGIILTAGAGIALWLLWTVPDADDLEALAKVTREGPLYVPAEWTKEEYR